MESLKNCIREELNTGLIHMVISGPRKSGSMKRYDLRPVMIRGRMLFQLEGFDGSQVFHENLDREETMNRLGEILPAYRNLEMETDKETISAMISKKGKVTLRRKARALDGRDKPVRISLDHNRTKRYILQEGVPVPFLIDLGVMTEEGRIVRKKYDKFRQINRFLEFIEDVLPALEDRARWKKEQQDEQEITILDFGCGKSYLTFAIYYYLHVLKELDIRIIGLDRKKKVIRDCQRLAETYGYDKLTFLEGDIEDYEGVSGVDMVVTLHACDTATDFALAKAVAWGAKVILSVPCCQHELNGQYRKGLAGRSGLDGRSESDRAIEEFERADDSGQIDPFAPVSDYGILKERFSALATDGIRARMLETRGYRTAILEFIDMEHTPKNLLIRAVLKEERSSAETGSDRMEQKNDVRTTGGYRDPKAEDAGLRIRAEVEEFCKMFGFRPSIVRLLKEGDRE